MTTHLLNDRLASFLMTLERLDTEGRKDAFMNEAIECGGSYVTPASGAQCNHLFQIDLHGISTFSWSEEEAIRNWMTGAKTVAPTIDDDGFITVYKSPPVPFPRPRNHAEEIENARAELDAGAD